MVQTNLGRRRSLRRVLVHEPDLPRAIVEALWENPDRLIQTGEMLKDGDRCTVVKLECADAAARDGHAATVLKRYNLKDPLHTAAHWFLRSRARWSWLSGRKLLAAGLPTPRPLACLEERRGGVARLGSYLLTQFIPGRSLRDAIDAGELSSAELRSLAAQFAKIWQRLGQLRIGHGDMKATNFIVDAQGKLWLIDLDGLRTYRSRTLLHRERRKDMARFMRNWQDQPEVAAVFRVRLGTS